jgi:hypothetical protein
VILHRLSDGRCIQFRVGKTGTRFLEQAPDAYSLNGWDLIQKQFRLHPDKKRVHAGYGVYFPELFPNQLRSTGTGFCFNGGRLLASTMLIFSGWLKALPGTDLWLGIRLMAGIFLFGIVIICRAQQIPSLAFSCTVIA